MTLTTQYGNYPFDRELVPHLSSLPAGGGGGSMAERRERKLRFEQTWDPVDLTGVDRQVVTLDADVYGCTPTLTVLRPSDLPTGSSLPCIYTIHGGGFMAGSPDETQARDARWVRELGAVVIGVDYRLAPESPFPAALDDCYAGLNWIADHAGELGIDRTRLAIYGTSAGGALAIGCCVKARDFNGPAIRFQCLRVPVVDDRLTTWSATHFVDTPSWDRNKAIESWRAYLGDVEPGSAEVPELAAPARVENLSGLPKTYVSVMEFDPLRDEGIQFASSLLQAGVSVELHLFSGTFHGSFRFRDTAVASRENAELVAVLRHELANPSA